jgi:transposase
VGALLRACFEKDRRVCVEKHPRRALVDAILYVVRTRCAWRLLPADFPPWQTVYWYFNRWEQYKVTEQILPVVC